MRKKIGWLKIQLSTNGWLALMFFYGVVNFETVSLNHKINRNQKGVVATNKGKLMKLCMGAFGFKINVVVATIWSFFIELVRICIVRCWDVFLKLTTRPFCFHLVFPVFRTPGYAGSPGTYRRIAGADCWESKIQPVWCQKRNTQNVQTNHRYCTVFVHFVANCWPVAE